MAVTRWVSAAAFLCWNLKYSHVFFMPMAYKCRLSKWAENCEHLQKGVAHHACGTTVASSGSSFVSQVNSLHVADPVEAVLQLQDCSVFIKIIDSMWVCTTPLPSLSSKATFTPPPCLTRNLRQCWDVIIKPVGDPEAKIHWPHPPVTMSFCRRGFTLVPS